MRGNVLGLALVALGLIVIVVGLGSKYGNVRRALVGQ